MARIVSWGYFDQSAVIKLSKRTITVHFALQLIVENKRNSIVTYVSNWLISVGVNTYVWFEGGK